MPPTWSLSALAAAGLNTAAALVLAERRADLNMRAALLHMAADAAASLGVAAASSGVRVLSAHVVIADAPTLADAGAIARGVKDMTRGSSPSPTSRWNWKPGKTRRMVIAFPTPSATPVVAGVPAAAVGVLPGDHEPVEVAGWLAVAAG
ncbi:MAG TPA: hypothetical protein VMV92_19030 [Streptosporangiaceae bacterium]|nr:hypothetical protein [Streptosporangiaceae bacterium]